MSMSNSIVPLPKDIEQKIKAEFERLHITEDLELWKLFTQVANYNWGAGYGKGIESTLLNRP